MKEKKNNSFLKGALAGGLAVGAILMVVFAFTIGAHNWQNVGAATGTTTGEVRDSGSNSAVLEKMSELAGYIDQYSIYEADDEALVNGAYKGEIESLDDPYSAYYTVDEYKELMQSTSGTYYGIGVLIQQNAETKEITLIRVFAGSPAEEAGLKAGDIIKKVAGQDVTEMESSAVVTMIKGEQGSKIDIEVERKGTDDKAENVTVSVERRKIEVPTITYKMLADQIGYIQISEFDEVTQPQFAAALKDLQSQGAKGLVFDIRDNPGGLLQTVVEMLDQLLPKGLIVYTEDKQGKREEDTSDADCITLPMAVIMNKNSASASEIFAGALQDYGVATLVGETSFGKGIVQRIFPLDDGTALKLTVAKYFTPNGRNIHGTGITPDQEVELPEGITSYAGIPEGKDTQLDAAVEAVKKQIK